MYFTSDRTGRAEVWRVGANGGPEEQVTRSGGSFPFESWDGRMLYYKASGISDDGRLLGRPTASGEERSILPCVPIFGYGVGPRGIYYHECGAASPLRRLHYWDTAQQQDRVVRSLEADWVGGLSVSPDGRSIIYGRGEATSDLMMVENFR